MLAKRILPCLDVKAGRVVKGVNFVDLRDAGDPVELAQAYNLAGADELVFLDITATHEDRNTILDVVYRTAEQVFIPLTVGGGVPVTGGAFTRCSPSAPAGGRPTKPIHCRTPKELMRSTRPPELPDSRRSKVMQV